MSCTISYLFFTTHRSPNQIQGPRTTSLVIVDGHLPEGVCAHMGSCVLYICSNKVSYIQALGSVHAEWAQHALGGTLISVHHCITSITECSKREFFNDMSVAHGVSFYKCNIFIHFDCIITEQKKHYPPANHHAIHL